LVHPYFACDGASLALHHVLFLLFRYTSHVMNIQAGYPLDYGP
jgi:hypothetical protein